MMKIINEEGDPDMEFVSYLVKTLGITEDQVNDLIEKLSADDLTNLIDGCYQDDAKFVRKIAGSVLMNNHSDDSGDDKKSVTDNAEELAKKWFSRKGHNAEQKQASQEEELGEETDTGPVSHNIGDTVTADGVEGTVKIPSAAGNTVGVMINGELKMVDKKMIRPQKVEEAVLGMTAMPGLKPNNDLMRIRELAGLPAEPMDSPMTAPAPRAAPAMGMGDDMGDDMGDMGDASMEPIVQDEPILPPIPGDEPPPMDAPMSMDMDDGSMGDDAPEMMGDMGSTGGLGSALEDAAALDQAISDIENMIPNIKISEYKTLVARLKALVSMAESAGKAALTEASFGYNLDDKFKSNQKPKGFAGQQARSVSVKGDLKARMAAFATNRATNKSEMDEDKISAKGMKKEPKDAADGSARKTLMDYVAEADGDMETIGADRNTALAAFQARMGPSTTPQQANQAFDAAFAAGNVKQVNGQFQMKAMGDGDFHQQMSQTGMAATAPATNGSTQQSPAPNDAQGMSNAATGSNTVNPSANVQGAPNGAYQGR
jgi:hypothetical protein